MSILVMIIFRVKIMQVCAVYVYTIRHVRYGFALSQSRLWIQFRSWRLQILNLWLRMVTNYLQKSEMGPELECWTTGARTTHLFKDRTKMDPIPVAIDVYGVQYRNRKCTMIFKRYVHFPHCTNLRFQWSWCSCNCSKLIL